MLKKITNSFAIIFETAKKEKELIFKDSAVIEIYIIFVTLVYFFYTFVYSPEIFTNLPVAYVDNDQTTISHQIRRMLNETESLEIAYDVTSLEEGRKLFEEGKVNGVILIPKDFSRQLQLSGGNASIAIYSDASYMLYYDKTLQAVTNALGAFTGELQLKQTMMSGEPMKQAVASSKPFNIIANPLYNLEEGYAIFLIPVVLIIALQTLQLTGMGVLYGTMRENDTFVTNFAMAKRRFGYFFMTIGRALPYLVISMAMLLMGILVVFHIFTIPQRGNLFEVVVFLIPVVLAITFLGQSLMNIFRNREDTIMLLTVFSIPALMMGGVSYPIVAFPLWIKVMGFFFPSTIGVKGFLALSQAGASLVEIKEIFIQMWLICGFYFILAVWTNRRFIYGLVPNKIPSTFSGLKEFKKNKQQNSGSEIANLETNSNEVLAIESESNDEISKDAFINSTDSEQNILAIEAESEDEITETNLIQPTDSEQNIQAIETESKDEITETKSAEIPEIQSKVEANSSILMESNISITETSKESNLLNPLKELSSGFDKTISNIDSLLTNKLNGVSQENLQTPAVYIAAPILAGLKFVADSEDLKNLYVNLLANAMDKNTAGIVHPSFVETIKYLTPDETKILDIFEKFDKIPFVNIIQIVDENSGHFEMVLEKHNHLIEEHKLEILHKDNLFLYLENLIRLGILSCENSILPNYKYDHLENCELNRFIRKDIENKGYHFKTERGYYKTTAYGNGFIKAAIKNK